MNQITFCIEYEWHQFKVDGKHLIFREYINNSIRLKKREM